MDEQTQQTCGFRLIYCGDLSSEACTCHPQEWWIHNQRTCVTYVCPTSSVWNRSLYGSGTGASWMQLCRTKGVLPGPSQGRDQGISGLEKQNGRGQGDSGAKCSSALWKWWNYTLKTWMFWSSTIMKKNGFKHHTKKNFDEWLMDGRVCPKMVHKTCRIWLYD